MQLRFGFRTASPHAQSEHTQRAYLGDLRQLMAFVRERGIDDLSQRRIVEFRHGATGERVLRETLHGGEETLCDDASVPRRVGGDVVPNLHDNGDRRLRPDDAHRVTQRVAGDLGAVAAE